MSIWVANNPITKHRKSSSFIKDLKFNECILSFLVKFLERKLTSDFWIHWSSEGSHKTVKFPHWNLYKKNTNIEISPLFLSLFLSLFLRAMTAVFHGDLAPLWWFILSSILIMPYQLEQRSNIREHKYQQRKKQCKVDTHFFYSCYREGSANQRKK